MFTGIITHLGRINGCNIDSSSNHIQAGRVDIKLSDSSTSASNIEFFDKVKLGCSIAVDGVCLTVTEFDKKNSVFSVDISDETVNKTNFKFIRDISSNKIVNLEHALVLGDSIDGHLVQGHVDTISVVHSITELNSNMIISLNLEVDNLPGNIDYIKYIAPKGSVTLNGISLTVNTVDNNIFTVNIIPHTQSQTGFKNLKVGDAVNLEIDLLSRYSINYLEYIKPHSRSE